MPIVIVAITDVFFLAKVHDAIKAAGAEMKLARTAALAPEGAAFAEACMAAAEKQSHDPQHIAALIQQLSSTSPDVRRMALVTLGSAGVQGVAAALEALAQEKDPLRREALVEAIAGPAKAAQVARDVGIANWSSRHDSDAFQSDPGNADMPRGTAAQQVRLGIPVKPGDDEIALALTAESYSRTGNTMAFAVAATKAPLRLAHGLVVLPDLVADGPESVDRMLAPLEAHQATHALDIALADITNTYGPKAARNVALFMEYPGLQ